MPQNATTANACQASQRGATRNRHVAHVPALVMDRAYRGQHFGDNRRMALAEGIWSRWDGVSERIPGRLGERRVPPPGSVVLPRPLAWHGLREFGVAKDESRLVLYSILLGQGRRGDLA